MRWLTEKMRFFGFCAPTQRCALPTQRSDVFEATIPGRRPEAAPEHLVRRRRALAGRDRRHGPPGQHRARAWSKRQRLRDRGADRARARVREPLGGSRRRPRPHAALPLHGRRLLRRARSGAIRRAPPGKDRRSRQPRLDRRSRCAAHRARRRPGSLTRAVARRDCRRADCRADRLRAAADDRARAAHRPRLPVHLLRAGPARRPRHPGDHADHGGRPSAGVVRRHTRAAQPQASDRHRPRDPGARRLDRRCGARRRDAELRLSRPAARTRMGNSVRARGDAAALRRHGGRSLCPLPPPEDPGRAGGARAAQPPRVLAVGRPRVLVPRRWSASGRTAPHAP